MSKPAPVSQVTENPTIGGGHPAVVQYAPQTNGSNVKAPATASVSGDTPVNKQFTKGN